MKMLLLLLSLLGAVITTTSSIYSVNNKLYKDTEYGKRSLLPAGYLSVGFTIMGLVITFTSGILGYKNAKREAIEKAARDIAEQKLEDEHERKRELKAILAENRLLLGQEFQTGILKAYNKYLIDESKLDAQKRELKFTQDIVLSGQPLKSVSFKWEFKGLNKSFADYMADRIEDALGYPERNKDLFSGLYGPRNYEMQDMVRRYLALYPLFHYICEVAPAEGYNNAPILVQISFDEQNSGVLSFGLINLSLAEYGCERETDEFNFSGALEYAENFAAFEQYGSYVRSSRISVYPKIEKIKRDEFQITWELDPFSLFNAMDLASPKAFVPSKLPDRFRIVMYYNIERLPFREENLALSSVDMPFQMRYFDPAPHFYDHNPYKGSVIRIFFNGLKDIYADYDVNMVHYSDIEESFDPPEQYCSVKIYECFKRK